MTFIGLIVLGWVIYKITNISDPSSKQKSIQTSKQESFKYNHSNKVKSKSITTIWNPGNIEIGKFKIPNALIYTRDSSYDDKFSSTITLRSPIQTSNDEIFKLGYWPNYQELTNNQRIKYLEWLSSGRNSDLNEVGYIFIFFYGLERRFFKDKKDKNIILKEVQRLLSKYGELSGSLRSYLGNFLIYGYLENGIDNITYESINILETLVSENTFLPIKLAYLYQNNLFLDPKTAFNISKSLDISNNRSVIVQRTSILIESLFSKKFLNTYGEHFTLKVSKRNETFHYRTATNDFYIENYLEFPNVLGISSQFKKLGLLFNECVEDLRKVSALIAKGISEDDPRYFSALPELLRDLKQHPLKNKFIEIINESEKKEIYNFIKINSLASLINIEPREKLTLTQSKNIVELCESLGYKIEPNPFITSSPYLWINEVAIFKIINIQENFINYNLCKLMLEIGIAISNSDGVIDQKEINHITSFIETTFANSKDEAIRIKALKYLYINNPPSITGLGKRIKENLNKSQIQIVAEFIVSLSTIDGELHKKEEKTLKTLFKAMEVDMSELEILLQKFKNTYEEPVEVLTENNIKGEIIPSEPIESIIKLDKEAIKKTLANTKEIASILGDILNEDEENNIKNNNIKIKKTNETIIKELDPHYKNIFNEIITKKEWNRIEFESLTKKYNLMSLAVIEVLNEWADETLDDFLIEEENDKIMIKLDLLGEI